MIVNDLLINLRRTSRSALERVVIDFEKPKARTEALDPLEVIEKRPMVIAADIDPVGDRESDLAKMRLQIAAA